MWGHRGRAAVRAATLRGRGTFAVVLLAVAFTTAGGAAVAPAATLGDRPLSGLRSWGEGTGRILGRERVTPAHVAVRLQALRRAVTRAAPRLSTASSTVRTNELARTRVVLGAALDPLAGTLRGTARDLFFVTYQHELERLASTARLDRTPTGRPLALQGGRAVVDLETRVRPDSDADGVSDADEIDDDGDGIVDVRDTSDQGWGIPDALQAREDLDDDVDEDGTTDTAADSLKALRDLPGGTLRLSGPVAEAVSGAYCLRVAEAVPALLTVAAARNLLDVAASRGCKPTPKVAAPAPAPVAGGVPAVRDATASGRTLLAEVRSAKAGRLTVAVTQRVVSGRDGSVRFTELRPRSQSVRVPAGRHVLRIVLGTALSPGVAKATITPAAGPRSTVPVTVLGTARVSPASTAPPVAAAPVAAPPAAAGPAAAGSLGRDPSAPVRLLSAVPENANRVLLTFDGPVDASAEDVASYRTSPDLFLTGAARLPGFTRVVLTTGRQYAVPYLVTADGVRGAGGLPLAADGRTAAFSGSVAVAGERPRMTSAGSTGNRTVLVQFSKPLADSALRPELFQIVRESLTSDSGGVKVLAARFADDSRLAIVLDTGSQNEVRYRVRVTGIVDITGQPLADRTGAAAAVDPTSAVFAGIAPASGRLDTDCDGVSDSDEGAGYAVRIVRADGQEVRTEVTSDPGRPGLDCASPGPEDDRDGDGVPDAADTDGDGLTDDVEKTLVTDPRDADTDDDGLTDDVEYNETFSDPLKQDTDADSLTDGLELTFFSTSALLPDTDGDQISDDTEITLGNRNPRVGDLPRPGLEVGGTDLRLDVRFTDDTGTSSKVVDTKSVSSELKQGESQKFSTTDQRTIEASTKLSTEVGAKIDIAAGADRLGARVTQEYTFKTSTEQSFSSSFMSQWSEESASQTERAYRTSQDSQAEQAESANRRREVTGARISATVDLKAAGDIAFTIRNLQLSAFMQDPQDPTRLTPVATLLPAAEPATGFALGPLVPQRGPIVFENSQVFPSQVEELMRNPRGLVFRFSNYDITDELGRNFAFTSQAVNDRTAGLVIDYGGFDADGDGASDETESRRVATGTGRRIDTSGDGQLGEDDRKAVFGSDGKHLGITLRDALGALGLTEYKELDTPTSSLSQREIDNSYSIYTTANGGEKLYRVRRTALEPGVARAWEIVGPTGIDGTATLDTQLLQAGQTYTFAFLADTDQDRVPAVVESLNRCVDSPLDADGDGRADSADSDGDALDDRFEIYVGWRATTERGSRQVRSRCASPDTDADGRSDTEEAPGVIRRDAEGLIEFTTGREPSRDLTGPEDPLLGFALTDPITDPASADTDLDGIGDDAELDGYAVELISPPAAPNTFTPVQQTSPEHFDSDRDTASDGVEQRIGGDPRTPDFGNFGDSDGDGVVNVLEATPYPVTVFARSTSTTLCTGRCTTDGTASTRQVTSDSSDPDSDDDGLLDGQERELRLDPRAADTDGDALKDAEEVKGFVLRDLGTITTDPHKVDSDRDRRADGVEAARTGTPIIVRVAGEDPYVGTSDPRDPDGDLDNLVDGDEAADGTDPHKANTDGDNQSDFDEVRSTLNGEERRPLVPDLYVEVTLAGMDVKSDGDSGDGAGEFEFGLTIRRPSGQRVCSPSTCSNDLGADLRAFPVNSHVDGGIALPGCGEGDQLTTCRKSDRIIQARDDRGEIPFREVIRVGSVSTSAKKYESFQIDGFVHELEGDELDCDIVFPNPLKADEAGGDSGIFPGSMLQAGVQALTLRNRATCPNEGNSGEVELRAFYTAG